MEINPVMVCDKEKTLDNFSDFVFMIHSPQEQFRRLGILC